MGATEALLTGTIVAYGVWDMSRSYKQNWTNNLKLSWKIIKKTMKKGPGTKI